MTDIKFGEPIRVDGVQPDWLRDEVGLFENCPDYWLGGVSDRLSGWAWSMEAHCPINIRLLADHPFYTVQNYNAEHGTNFKYWPGGESAPDDWDGGNVLRGDGELIYARHIGNWGLFDEPRYHVIGYTKRTEAVTLHIQPQPDNFTNESPIRAFTD